MTIAATELPHLAVAADELGFDPWWMGEHVVSPLGRGSLHPPHDAADEHASMTGPIIRLDT